MGEQLTKEIAYQALKNFFKEKPLVLFGTGVSCAMDTKFGMGGLRKELEKEVPKKLSSKQEKEEWCDVRTALKDRKVGLESALNSVKNQTLVRKITDISGKYVAKLDKNYSFKIYQKKKVWAACQLFQKLVNGLPEPDRILHVVTPNYDMLMEYACDTVGISYINGFVGGVKRTRDWDSNCRQVQYLETNPKGKKLQKTLKYKKHIRLFKVHGSLNLFQVNGEVVENNAWMWDPPDFTERVIITPGISKYEKITQFREELLEQADRAIKKESVFLFIGYGFNDNHLETYINPKLINQRCLGLIITRDSNERIDKLMEQAENLWLVCKKKEENSDVTVIWNKKYSNELLLSDKKLWDISEFTQEILGD